MNITCSELIVRILEGHGVSHIFGIPGAKVDHLFNVLADHGPKLVLCRHEQNAAFMAQAVGRLTCKAGVCLVTSGPGVANLVTGLLTATSEGDPVVALGGSVPRAQLLKNTHQVVHGADVMRTVTKYSAEVSDPSVLAEVLANAFRISETSLPGAVFVSLPKDILEADVDSFFISRTQEMHMGASPEEILRQAAEKISTAKCPVLLLGMSASKPHAAAAVRAFLKKHPLPVVCTYQGAGVVSRDLLKCFVGRVGLFANQPGDTLLSKADVIVSIGFQPIEYDPHLWNTNPDACLISMNVRRGQVERYYQPSIELLGSYSDNLSSLALMVKRSSYADDIPLVKDLQKTLFQDIAKEPLADPKLIHPLHFIKALSEVLDDDDIVTCDVGSHYIWLARYFLRYQPRRLLFSNGQQTLGVALPWAMAASLLYPQKKIVSVSGDGGFLFSAMELETAVRMKCNLVHFVWRDDCYDMVKIQEEMKYGRSFGVALGNPDIVRFAESFGAKGLRINSPKETASVLKKAFSLDGPVVVDVPIDYRDNKALCEALRLYDFGQ